MLIVTIDGEPLGGRNSALVVAPIAVNMEAAERIVKAKTSPFFTINPPPHMLLHHKT